MPGATSPADMLSFFMALPFFVDPTPRAYRLKAGDADLPISTSFGTFPDVCANVTGANATSAAARAMDRMFLSFWVVPDG